MITADLIIGFLKTFGVFLLKQWKYVIIVLLIILLYFSNSRYDKEVLSHKETITKHQKEIANINETALQQIITMKDEVIKSQNKVNEVHREYQDKVNEQSVRTEIQIKEIEKYIPSVVRESCDFGANWLLGQNDYIRSSNNATSKTSD